MKRILLFLLLIAFALPPYAQQRKTRNRRTPRKTIVQKRNVRKQNNKRQNNKRQNRRQQNRRQQRNTAAPNFAKTKQIRGLEQEKQTIQRDINNKQKEYNDKEVDVKQRLSKIDLLNADLVRHQQNIDTIQYDIRNIDNNIGVLKGQIKTLESELGERRDKFIQSMRYMARHRRIQDKLMFIFSAKSLTQMYRRMRFVRQYAAYQRKQGEILKQQQEIIGKKHIQLKDIRGDKSNLLWQNRHEHAEMENTKAKQQEIVASLKEDQVVLQNVIKQQHQKQNALDAQIDRLISIEIEKAHQRAAAEARARRAAQAAAEKAHAAELARKREAARRAAQENARRIAEARAREAKAKEAARQAARAAEQARRAAEQARREAEAAANAKKAQERAEAAQRKAAAQAAAEREQQAQQAARQAEAERLAAERKAEVERKRAAAEERNREKETAVGNLSTSDRALTGSFASIRGRLPMPLRGRIITHYGQYDVEGLNNVRLSNSGINIKGAAGGGVRAVFRGEVSAVFRFGGTSVVMVRHGAYITVYANLGAVRVHKGQQVSTGQYIGNVSGNGILQFQLRKETAKLNPESWLRR